MNVLELDIDIYVGSACVNEVICYTDCEMTEEFDFTGYDGVGAVWDKFGDGKTKICDITVGFNIPGTDGILKMIIAKAVTGTLTPGNYVYDVLTWASSGDEEQVTVRGVARVHAQGTERS